MSKLCKNCGYTNADYAKFCVRCGARLDEEAAPLSAAVGGTDEGTEERKELTAPEGGRPADVRGETRPAPDAPKNAPEGAEKKPEDTAEKAPEGAEPPREERKVRAEWNGSDCRLDYGGERPSVSSGQERQSFTTANGTPYYRSPSLYPYAGPSAEPRDYARRRMEETAQRARARSVSKRKALFILAFVGLMLDFWCGIGALLCLPVAILASVEARRLYREEKKTSAQLLWAMVIGYVGSALGLVFFILMI